MSLMPEKALFYISILVFLYFSYKRALIYMGYYQQEEYDAKRFLSWVYLHKAFDKRGLGAIILSYITYLIFDSSILTLAVCTLLFLFLIYKQKDPRKTGKIKLKMTARASRIFYIACFLFVALYLLSFLTCLSCHFSSDYILSKNFIVQALLLQFIPFAIIISNILLSPLEKRTKQKYINEAKQILAKVNPHVIGITGSYGKTSVKAALGEVLNSALAPTFCPPKSINTVMGITREIRERLKENHKYAVIEMGAYNVGSINRLCDLTPPHSGLVTIVGMAHLERYGSVERIYKAKSELPQRIPSKGTVVYNGDNDGTRKMSEEFPKEKTFLYGFDESKGYLDCVARDLKVSYAGTDFELEWKGKKYKAFTKLHGKPALSNLLGVFTMACVIGADPELVIACIRNIEPVDNRLSVSRENGVNFIRDAYNSNPDGFAAALEVLGDLEAKQKILMTPGMVELGSEQYEQNKKAGFLASKSCDKVLLVGDTNYEALKAGLLEGEFEESNIIVCKNRDEAFLKLNEYLKADNLILIENDLPDLYEVEDRF